MKPAGIRRDAMRRKRHLLTNRFTTVNTGTNSYRPPSVDPVFAYRARARPLSEDAFKLFGLDEGVPNDPRMAAQAYALFEEWGIFEALRNHEMKVNGRRRKVILFWLRGDDKKITYFFVEIVYPTEGWPMIRRSLGMNSREFANMLYDTTGPRWRGPFEPLIINLGCS
jgi:hypothetical protein